MSSCARHRTPSEFERIHLVTPKSQLAIRRELKRVVKAKNASRKGGLENIQFRELFGAEQALAWAMGDNAMAPAKCFGRLPKR